MKLKTLNETKRKYYFKPFIWTFVSTRKNEYNLLYICVIEASF